MIIENDKPIIKPATQEVIFDGFWASQVIVSAPSPQSKASVFITLKPLNSQTQEVLETTETITIPDLWATADKTPEVAAAVLGLINGIDIVRKNKIINDKALAEAKKLADKAREDAFKAKQDELKAREDAAKAKIEGVNP